MSEKKVDMPLIMALICWISIVLGFCYMFMFGNAFFDHGYSMRIFEKHMHGAFEGYWVFIVALVLFVGGILALKRNIFGAIALIGVYSFDILISFLGNAVSKGSLEYLLDPVHFLGLVFEIFAIAYIYNSGAVGKFYGTKVKNYWGVSTAN